jgi:hypothetical protein
MHAFPELAHCIFALTRFMCARLPLPASLATAAAIMLCSAKNCHVAAPGRTRAMQCSVGSMHSLAAVGKRLRQGLESGGVERGVVCE